ncbi:hypothetical protein E2C01_048635 [Portunus trituberculatus]|uniref:Uncharacterized protein n=1 Tax=Portunus trituberculatus TaxID=210409 RepID=A0A5B7G4B7_PORTR|nr:hypothetical protein [Portunus trituberculatus]
MRTNGRKKISVIILGKYNEGTSSPSLTALLKGTGPASSQAAVSVPRPQVVSLVGAVSEVAGHSKTPTSDPPSSSLNVSGLQQLLAG